MKISFSPPDYSEREIEAVAEAMRSGWITTGPRTKEFERRLAAQFGNPRAVCLNSQTICAEMTLRILGIGPGDEVIVPAYTYSASASVIDHVGATIVMIDSQADHYEMDYDRLEAAITPRTKAVIPVDIGGIICDYRRIFEIVERKRDLFQAQNDLQAAFGRVIVIADTAHSLGAVREGIPAGRWGDFSNFSFHAVKNLTTAEGGCATWKDHPGLDHDDLYRRFMLYSLHGQSKDAFAKNQPGSWEYDIEQLGYKGNMTDIAAAIGLIQLDRYPDLLRRRKEIIRRYDRAFADLPIDAVAHDTQDACSSGHLYMIHLRGKSREACNAFISAMAADGIACNVHYKPLPLFTAYRKLGFSIEDYPNAHRLFRNEVTLPLHTRLTDEEVDYICARVAANLSGQS
jgi:dTDP-4-amino-4,6-dideoxygalactose transaminase